MAITTPRTALDWEYSPAPEATDHIRLKERYELFVDGAWRPPEAAALTQGGCLALRWSNWSKAVQTTRKVG